MSTLGRYADYGRLDLQWLSCFYQHLNINVSCAENVD
jgi:hypothetical protein